jgi:hypothetical protein
MPAITSLSPGHRPPQVTIAARVFAGSKKIFRRGPHGSIPGSWSGATPREEMPVSVSSSSTRSFSLM